MKVTIEWPSLLNGITPLQLVTIGKVVRRKGPTLAVALEHYQFRTMSRKKAEHTNGEVDIGMQIPEPSLESGSYLPGKPSRLRKMPESKPEQHRASVVVIG